MAKPWITLIAHLLLHDLSQLRRNRRRIDHRPNLLNLPITDPIENVLRKGNAFAVDGQAEEFAFWGAVELQAAGDQRGFAGEEVNVEMKVRDFAEGSQQHIPVA